MVDFVQNVSDTARGLLDHQCSPLFLIQLLVQTDFVIAGPSNKLLCCRTKAMCAWLSLMVAMFMMDPQLYLEVNLKCNRDATLPAAFFLVTLCSFCPFNGMTFDDLITNKGLILFP